MADTKISALGDIATLADGDKVPVADASDLTVSKSATMAEVATYISAITKAVLTEQGDVLYGSAASTPAALAHGTVGQHFQTGGHGANPSWSSAITLLQQQYNNNLMQYLPLTSIISGYTNSSFEYSAGGWTKLHGYAMAQSTTQKKYGQFSLKLTASTGDYTQATYNLPTAWYGKQVTFGAWIWADVAARAHLKMYSGTADSSSSNHTGDSTWQWITMTVTLANSGTPNIQLIHETAAGTENSYFDEIYLCFGSSLIQP